MDASAAAEASAQAARVDQERRLREVAEAREVAERQLRTESEARADAERESRTQVQRRSQLFRRFGWAMTTVALIASITAGYAWRQQRVAESRQLAAEAQELRGRDQPGALNLAFKAWRVAETTEAHRAIAAAFPTAPTVLTGHTDYILSAAFSPDGQRVVTASRDGTARVWDARTGHALATLQGHTDIVWSAVFSPDGQRVVTASADETARVWDARTGQAVATLQGHTRRGPERGVCAGRAAGRDRERRQDRAGVGRADGAGRGDAAGAHGPGLERGVCAGRAAGGDGERGRDRAGVGRADGADRWRRCRGTRARSGARRFRRTGSGS